MSYKGRFRPHYPSKYKGNPTNIIYRSLWEWKFMRHLDLDPRIIEWASEEFCIPYYDPSSRKPRRYFPDIWARTKEKTMVFEIKPYRSTLRPIKNENAKNNRKFIKETLEYFTNDAKWAAARKYCEERKWEFKIMTEKELGIPSY